MALTDIDFKNIKESFNSLWHLRRLSLETVEIVTPFATVNNKFVSLFISEREEGWVVSDGGWLLTGNYDIEIDEQNHFIDIFAEKFEIKKVKRETDNISVFYKTTKDKRFIPNLILYMGSFITQTIGAYAVLI